MNLELDVEGLDDVVRALEQVEQKTSIKVIRAALRYAAKPAIDRAKALVPHDGDADEDGYTLRDSIGIRTEAKKNRRGNAVNFRFGPHRETADASSTRGYRIKGGLNRSARAPNYAQLIEDESPFLLPAIEQTAPQVIARFGERIKRNVSRL